jgi:hypothetical protein
VLRGVATALDGLARGAFPPKHHSLCCHDPYVNRMRRLAPRFLERQRPHSLETSTAARHDV